MIKMREYIDKYMGGGYNKADRPTTGTGQPACKIIHNYGGKNHENGKEVSGRRPRRRSALSVLTGCGKSANTKSIAEAMSDIGKTTGVTVKEDTKLNTKAKAIVEALANTAATVTITPTMRLRRN